MITLILKILAIVLNMENKEKQLTDFQIMKSTLIKEKEGYVEIIENNGCIGNTIIINKKNIKVELYFKSNGSYIGIEVYNKIS